MPGPLALAGRRRMAIDGRGAIDWDAIRAEYVAGKMSQRALAELRGVPYRPLCRHSAAEGWAQARIAAHEGLSDAGEDGNGQIAARLRRKLLMRIERVADEIPDGAVTEIKSQDDGRVLLFKLRDLTAAYKDMAGDILKGDDADVADLSPLEELLGE